MIKADFKIDQRFKKRIQARYGRFEVQAGILENKTYYPARTKAKGLASLEGGPARKRGRVPRGTVADVGEAIRKQHGVDYLRKPLRAWRSQDMVAFRKAFVELLAGKAKGYSRVETALRRVIRDPILQQRYGRNSRFWARVKGFNRKLIDTGQFFRAITAKIRVKKPRV